MRSRTRADIFAPVMEELPGAQDAAPALSVMSTAVVDAGDLKAFCGRVMDAAARMLGADYASIQTKAPAQPALQLLGEMGFTPEASAFWQRVDAGSSSTCGQALSRGQRIIVPDVERDEHLAGTDDLRQMRLCGIRAVQSTPLVSRSGACVGMLSTHWRHAHQPPARTLRLLDVVASHAAALMERVAVEEALRASEAALRLRVAALEAADREKNHFLAMLGHELRGPLAPINNVRELLAQMLLDQPAAQRPLAILKRQTDQLTRLVADLLDIARIQEGRMALEERPIEIGAVLEQAIETVQPLLREKQQRLSVARLATPVLVLADRARLVQCVGNLLHNAAKYTGPDGEIKVEVRAADTRVSIVVSDNGAGISPALLPHVFNLFVQNEETLEHSHGGMGIGLAIVKRLVEMHGGSVAAASGGEGRGSTFAIHLPRLDSPQTPYM
jgi:signal transduction histidine kinase